MANGSCILGQNSSGMKVAVKIFDNELAERFGHKIQDRRIQQEIGLKNHGIPNLISIEDGGQQELNGERYYYIVMDYIDGDNLKGFINKGE